MKTKISLKQGHIFMRKIFMFTLFHYDIREID